MVYGPNRFLKDLRGMLRDMALTDGDFTDKVLLTYYHHGYDARRAALLLGRALASCSPLCPQCCRWGEDHDD
jgi:hypothetical protein